MTVSNEVYRHDYVGNDSTILFTIGFYFLVNAHIKAILYNSVTDVETELTLTTHYTLTGAGNVNGGELTMITAPTSDETLTILRSVDVKQESNYVDGTSFPAEDHEESLDKLTMLSQQLKEEVERGLRLAKSQPGTWTLPTPIANYFLRYNADADAFETFNIADLSLYTVSAFAETLLDDLTSDAARATLGAPPNDNILINQDFSIWQEKYTFTNPADGIYAADGYFVGKADGGGTAPSINVKKNTTDMETGFEQCCELEITNIGATGGYWRYQQKIKDYKKYAGKTLTGSIRLKASTAITAAGARLWLYDGITVTQVLINSLGTNYTTYSVSLSVGASATQLQVIYEPMSTAGAISTTGSIYIQWMNLELGSVATPLIPRKIGEELRLCKRSYQKSYAQGTFAGAVTGPGSELFYMSGVTSLDYGLQKNVRFPIMNAVPTITIYDVAGNEGKVTMSAGNNITGTVSNITESGFAISGTNGEVAITRILNFHWVAISRP